MIHILEKDCVMNLQPRRAIEVILVSSFRLIHPLISGHIYSLFVMSIFIAPVVLLWLFFPFTNTPLDFDNFCIVSIF